MSWRLGEPRFVLREIEGFPIDQRNPRKGALTRRHNPMLSVAVLDAAYCYEMVARFNQEDYPRPHLEVGTRARACPCRR